MSGEHEQHILVMLGRIEGELKGINTQIQQNSAATNQRIDDLKAAMNKRMDDLKESTDERFESVQKQFDRRSAAVGGVGGVSGGLLVSGLTELLKAMMK